MKNNKIYRNAAVAMAFLAAGAMTTACSDWDDHYDNNGVSGSASETIWENVKANANLSQFADLIHKAGYDEVINTTQTYTVWAPLNGTFNYDSLNALPLNNLKQHFAMNHVARFNYPASGSVDAAVTMLNKKVMPFSGNGTYTFNGVEVVSPNVASSNGMLHVTNGMVNYMANLFESLDSMALPIDSISRYFHNYDQKVLDEANSVKGPVVDGRLTYLDSVFVEQNILLYLHKAMIHLEDSNYTMLLPSDEAWQKAYKAVKSCFNYKPFTFVKDIPQTNLKKATAENYDTGSTKLDFDLLNDSIIHYMICKDLFFNNNLYHNRVLNDLQTGAQLSVDSLVNTDRSIFYGTDASDMFADARRIDKSNGSMWLTDSLRLRPWLTYNPIIKIQGEYGAAKSYNAGATTVVPISKAEQNPDIQGNVSNGYYLTVTPSAPASNPEAIFYLPEVRSTTYAVYVCFVPENINASTYTDNVRPNIVQVTMGYNDLKGKPQEQVLKVGTKSLFQSDITKVDTVYVGDFTFPLCYFGTGISNVTQASYAPYIRINSRATGKPNVSPYDRNLRIDYIMLVPKDLDNYIKEHPGYKYQHEID